MNCEYCGTNGNPCEPCEKCGAIIPEIQPPVEKVYWAEIIGIICIVLAIPVIVISSGISVVLVGMGIILCSYALMMVDSKE